MKAKKVMALCLSTIMVLTMAACGKDGGNISTVESSNEVESMAVTGGEVTSVKISYPTLVVQPSEEGTKDVQDAINKYLEDKGEDVRVELEPISASNYSTQTDMAIVGGEEVDVYCPLDGLDEAVNSNKIIPLDDYLDNELAGALSVMGEEFKKNCEFNGKTYALPCYKGSVLVYYWVCNKEVFDSLGIERDSVTDIRDLSPILGMIKEKYPDKAAIAPTIGTNGDGNSFSQIALMGGVGDYEITKLNNGLCTVGDDKTIRNMFETDAFKEMCEIAYDWNQNGYTVQDASVSTDTPASLMEAGRAASYIVGYAYDTDSVEEMSLKSSTPYETVAIPIAKQMLSPIHLTYGIAHTCKNPEAAAKVLNMLYTDEYVINTLIYGIEGTDWVDAETGDGSILWPEGKDMNSVPYTAALSCGVIGNQFIMYSMEGVSKASDVPFMKENMENAKKSPIFGFNVNIENIKTQTASVSNVIAQYSSGLLTGELDPEVYIPKMNEELKSAGMDDVVAEAQKQLDTWK